MLYLISTYGFESLRPFALNQIPAVRKGMSPYIACQAFRPFDFLEDVSSVEFVPALFRLRDKLFPLPFWTSVGSVSSSDSPVKSTLNVFPLTVVGRLLERFWNTSRSSIATLRYSNERAFWVSSACLVYRTK
jgi:hypothetical protein